MAKIGRRVRQFILHRILHADDSPHRLALGVAVGIFIAWTPTIGLQMILSVALATLLRANVRVGVPIVWISNPLTLLPIYLPNYWVGHHVLGLFVERARPDYTVVRQVLGDLFQFKAFLTHFYQAQFWRELWHLLWSVSLDLWIGSLIVGLFLGGISYIITHRLIVWYRTHHPRGRRIFALLERRRRRKTVSS